MTIPPQVANIHMDSCAFDPKYSPEDKSAEEIYQLYKKSCLNQNWNNHFSIMAELLQAKIIYE